MQHFTYRADTFRFLAYRMLLYLRYYDKKSILNATPKTIRKYVKKSFYFMRDDRAAGGWYVERGAAFCGSGRVMS
jgi:hypothetical protein